MEGYYADVLEIGFNILSLEILDNQLYVVSDNNEVFIYGYLASFVQ
jgi:hypothetical protein